MFVLLLLIIVTAHESKATNCYNNYACCAGWAASGHCRKSAFVKRNCPAACDVCLPNYKADFVGQCNDYLSICKRAAGLGGCLKSADWMEENCRESCQKCGYPRHSGCPKLPPVTGCDINEQFIRSCGACEHFCTGMGLSKQKLCWETRQYFFGEPCPYDCRCYAGYIQDLIESTGKKCIFPSDCIQYETTTVATTASTQADKCGPYGKIEQSCDSCGHVCTSSGIEHLCWNSTDISSGQQCPFMCVCREGFLKDWTETFSSTCILPRQCIGSNE